MVLARHQEPGRLGPEVPGSARATVLGRFLRVLADRPDAVALRWRESGGWAEHTWRSYAAAAAAAAGGLRDLGVRRGERLVLLVGNRPELHVLDLAAMLVGAVPVSVYTSSPPERLRYLVRHSRAAVAVAEGPEELGRLLALREDLPSLRQVVVVDAAAAAFDGSTVPLAQLARSAPVDLPAAVAATGPGDPVTVVYTSGTTGIPKGAVITHRNVVAAVDGLTEALGHGVAGRRMVSFLPMAHIAERVASHYVHLAEGTDLTTCPDPGLIATYLPDVRPELFFAVPRVWEKAVLAIRRLAATEADRGRGFEEAVATAAALDTLVTGGQPVSEAVAARGADAARALAPVRAMMGLDRCEVAVSTGAPIDPAAISFLRGLGVPLSELYGLTEATGPVTWDPVHPRTGDVGVSLPGVEVGVSVSGEVLVRGPTVFAGYLDDPEGTAAVLDADGWLHTGDLGTMEDGRLRIVDREKDLLVTAGGENVAPAPLETSLRAHPLVSEAFVAGDRRPYLVGLVTLDAEATAAFLADAGGPAERPSTVPAIRAEIERWVAQVNEARPRVEQIKRFAILEGTWAVDSDELTPTMKLRRRAVLDKYAHEIDELYAGTRTGG